MAQVHDRLILDLVDQHPFSEFSARVFRVTWATRNPLMGSASGGRWSPSGGFEALYASLERDGALAEAYFHLSRAPIMSSSSMKLSTLELSLTRVLHLDDAFFAQVPIEDPRAYTPELAVTQAIGSAAHLVDAEAIRVPSARWPCENLMLFLDQIDMNSQLSLVEQEEINWPAWRERR